MTDLLLSQSDYFEQQLESLNRYNELKPVLESKSIAGMFPLRVFLQISF